MKKTPYPSEIQDRFIIRLPDGMRDFIAEEAKKNNRSMNAEIVSRLQASFEESRNAPTTAELLVDDVIEAASEDFKRLAMRLLEQFKPKAEEKSNAHSENDGQEIKKVQAYLKNKDKKT